ncbi:MAG: DEAD/DEAH box helicase [Mediterranea sp.]|jgi:superfamily II DNA/RNA helicase|nr:DEAD/DEAH box helicase [Mediterranea sp.]
MNEQISSALQHLKIAELNEMQLAALRHAAGDEDMILLSPTGSGKTLAYLLPLLLALEPEGVGVQALILVPSRELALQIEAVFKAMDTPWKACCCYGGHPIGEEKKNLMGNHPAVIIGTPGRVTDHLGKGNFDPATIHTLVIDEFDKSLELGFQDEMAEIIAQLPGLRKRMLLSATDAEEIPRFAGLRRVVKLNFLADGDAETAEQASSRLKQMQVLSPDKDKIETLYRLLCSLAGGSSIVFCNHRDAVDRVHKLLAEKKLFTERFHGGMEQPDRERALYKFRVGSCATLISTDLASRGLDIPEVANIIHYHLPVGEEAFTHRNGRTARWDATGTSFLILGPEERLPAYITGEPETFELPEHTPRPPKPLWATIYIGRGKKEKLSRTDIAGLFYKKGGLSRDDVGPIDIREHYAFVAVRQTKVKQLLNLVQGEKIKGMKTLIELSDR